MDELIVFFMREFGWTLHYTLELLLGKKKAKKILGKGIPLKKLNALTAETKYQKAMEDYNLKKALFNIVTNSHTKHPKGGEELLGQLPTRSTVKRGTSLYEAAERVGIQMPKGGENA